MVPAELLAVKASWPIVRQTTATLLIFAAATVPVADVTVHDWFGAVGCVPTVTAYAPPPVTAVAKVNAPFAATGRLSPPLSCRTRPVPASPETVPPTVALAVEHVTVTFVTLALAVPVPFVTAHVWTGADGCVLTVTLYAPPALTAVVNEKEPLAIMLRLLPPLSCRTKPVPASPETVPPIVY